MLLLFRMMLLVLLCGLVSIMVILLCIESWCSCVVCRCGGSGGLVLKVGGWLIMVWLLVRLMMVLVLIMLVVLVWLKMCIDWFGLIVFCSVCDRCGGNLIKVCLFIIRLLILLQGLIRKWFMWFLVMGVWVVMVVLQVVGGIGGVIGLVIGVVFGGGGVGGKVWVCVVIIEFSRVRVESVVSEWGRKVEWFMIIFLR